MAPGQRAAPSPDARREAAAEDIINRMMERIVQGWSVVEDNQCPYCA